jgi:AraC-like DNA-binding protein/quercetin dioxygenase-like cupin family protein
MISMQDPPRLFQETLFAPVVGPNITLKGAGLYVAKQAQHFPAHYHEELEIILYRSGHIQCAVEGNGVFQTQPGMVLVLPPRLVHQDLAITAYSQYYLHLERPRQFANLEEPLALNDDTQHSLERLLDSIAAEWHTSLLHREQMLGLCAQQLELVLDRLSQQTAANASEQMVRAVEHLIEERYVQNPSIRELALEVGLAPSTMRALFAGLRGYSPKEYMQQIRLKRVIELIRSTSLSLEEIAELVGYDSASHLSRHVKQATNLTPGAFRANIKG